MTRSQRLTNQLARTIYGAAVERITPDPHYSRSGSGVRVDFDNGAKLWLEEFDVLAPREKPTD